MASDLDGESQRIPVEERLNVFALVIYIPGPLGILLDNWRRKLVPGCNPHAHVSLLPPRPLAVDWPVASEQVRTALSSSQPFEIELTGIGIFPFTDVIYIEVGRGTEELRRLHQAVNADTLEFQDPFPYHPHITLAQELPPEKVAATSELARRLWSEYTGPRCFPANRATFVQNSLNNRWVDLAEYTIGGSPLKS